MSEVLTSSAAGTVPVVYVYTLTASGCDYQSPLTVSVLPPTEPGCTSAVAGATGKERSMNIYPNPAKSSFTISISWPAAEAGRMTVSDVLGRVVHEGTVTSNQPKTIAMNGVPGVYAVRVAMAGVVVSRMLLVE